MSLLLPHRLIVSPSRLHACVGNLVKIGLLYDGQKCSAASIRKSQIWREGLKSDANARVIFSSILWDWVISFTVNHLIAVSFFETDGLDGLFPVTFNQKELIS